MTWYPDRLIIANVAGRGLISDGYIVAEYRNDPWKGFDLGEGVWRAVKRRSRQYEPYVPGPHHYGPVKQDPAKSLRSVQPWKRTGMNGGSQSVLDRDRTYERLDGMTGKSKSYTVFRSRWKVPGKDFDVHVNTDLLNALLHIIDGEPQEWRSAGPTCPLDAWDGKHWCGAIMPVRVAA